jgi:lysylphosphatidylglycerol synthetase-like protein (DUF2156 family)
MTFHFNQLKTKLDINNFDLGHVDELFAVFVGATLVLSFSGWQSEHPRIIIPIVVSVILVSVCAVAASNVSSIRKRYLCYLSVVFFTVVGICWVTYQARGDLSLRVSAELRALPIGVIVWIAVRELAIFIMNIFKVDKVA